MKNKFKKLDFSIYQFQIMRFFNNIFKLSKTRLK